MLAKPLTIKDETDFQKSGATLSRRTKYLAGAITTCFCLFKSALVSLIPTALTGVFGYPSIGAAIGGFFFTPVVLREGFKGLLNPDGTRDNPIYKEICDVLTGEDIKRLRNGRFYEFVSADYVDPSTPERIFSVLKDHMPRLKR